MARPSKGLAHVDELRGDKPTKERLKWILRTLLGRRSVQEALLALGIGRTYFAMLRKRVLERAYDSLQPMPCGRPRRAKVVAMAEVDALRRRVAELERDNALLQARLDIAKAQAMKRSSCPKSREAAAS